MARWRMHQWIDFDDDNVGDAEKAFYEWVFTPLEDVENGQYKFKADERWTSGYGLIRIPANQDPKTFYCPPNETD